MRKEYFISSNEKMDKASKELIKTISKKAEEFGVNVDDVLEKMYVEKNTAKFYGLLLEALDRLQ